MKAIGNKLQLTAPALTFILVTIIHYAHLPVTLIPSIRIALPR